MTSLKITDLKIHPKNEYYFDDIQGEKWDRLLESIKTNGVRTPIIVTDDMTVVSGNQRVRACKQLGISVINAEVQHYQSEDDVIRDLIEINIRQRGVIDDSEIKQGRRFEFLKNYYGVKQGNNKNRTGNNFPSKTSEEIAKESGVTKRTMDNYIRLSKAIPEIQELVETGKVSPTTALSIIRQLPEDEQRKLFEQISGSQERATSTKVQELINQIAEKDRKISELENRKPEIKKIEVEPEDYKQLKHDLKEETKRVGALRQDLRIEKQRYDQQAKEKRKLEEKFEELQQQTVREEDKRDVNASALMFAAKCRNFLTSVGGYAFIAEYLAELDERERNGYIHAAESVRDWVLILLDTIERNKNELFGSYK